MAQFESYKVAYATIMERTEDRIKFLIAKIKEYHPCAAFFQAKMRLEVELNTALHKKNAIKNFSELTKDLGFEEAKKDLLDKILDINIKSTSNCPFEKMSEENKLNAWRELYSEVEKIRIKD